MSGNPQVSLLIDTRSDAKAKERPVMALTVYGKAAVVADPQERQALIDRLVARNGDLAVLAGDARCLVVRVKMERMLLLDGVNGKSTIDIGH